MFGGFKKRSAKRPTLEQKLAMLAGYGLTLAAPFTVEDLLESWSREQLEAPGFRLVLAALGMTEERPPWRNHCVNVWHFDTECIEDNGSYTDIAERMVELTQGALVLENLRDQVDIEAEIASLDFDYAGEPMHIDLKVNNDWADPAVFSLFVRILATADPSKLFLYHDAGGQDCIIACVTRDQFVALREAGLEFEALQ